MENESNVSQTQEESSIVYVVGAIIVVAIVVAAVLMWPKNKPAETTVTPTSENKVVIKPTLTALVCESEWFNPVIGLPKYYLSSEGGDVSAGQQIECTFTVLKDKEAVITEKTTVPVVQAPERGGTTYKCTTKGIERIPQNIPLTFVTTVKNDAGETASCSGNVIFR